LNSDIWTGTWQYAVDTARWSLPGHDTMYRAQTMEVVAQGRDRLWIRTHQVYSDGRERSWVYDGAFDGRPYPTVWEDDGSLMTTIAFHLVTDLMGADAYEKPSPDGTPVRGAEYFMLGEHRTEAFGCLTVDNKQYPYWEEWHRSA
jgi:hypothetical protein